MTIDVSQIEVAVAVPDKELGEEHITQLEVAVVVPAFAVGSLHVTQLEILAVFDPDQGPLPLAVNSGTRRIATIVT